MNFSKTFFLILIFFFNISLVNSSEKIAFINLDKVLNNSNYGKLLLNDIKKLNDENIEKLKNNETILKKKEDDLSKKKNIISEQEFNKELDALKEKIKAYKKEKDKMVSEIDSKRINNLNNFFSKINPIIQEYMDDNSINLLFEQKNVFIGKNSFDITEDIIKEINNKLEQ
tara:strand:+ start:2386 stop:2898 length:513 start_codon:yes stop_codon:yes gene_type:complete